MLSPSTQSQPSPAAPTAEAVPVPAPTRAQLHFQLNPPDPPTQTAAGLRTLAWRQRLHFPGKGAVKVFALSVPQSRENRAPSTGGAAPTEQSLGPVLPVPCTSCMSLCPSVPLSLSPSVPLSLCHAQPRGLSSTPSKATLTYSGLRLVFKIRAAVRGKYRSSHTHWTNSAPEATTYLM